MNSTYEDTLFDFDLNLLNQTANVATIQEKCDRIKQKKSVALVKKKIIATDSLIAKYYGKRVSSDETDKALVAYKEECKQSLIKYRDVLESYNQLQNDYQRIQIEHAKCPESLTAARNQTDASISHAHQLQVLLKEKETESTRGEKKSKKTSDKNYDKKVDQTIETLRKDLFLFINLVKKQSVYTKRPLKPKYKSLIRTYETSREGKNHDWGDYSDAEDNSFEDAVLSPPPNIVNMVKKCSASSKDIVPIESDNDYSNEVVSIDTGRGSSLAFSDNEKCINSPDYFINDSPLNGENIVIKARPQVVSIATSPIMFEVSESLSSSSTSDLPSISESHPNSLNTVDISLTPIILKKTVYTSPLKKITREIATSTDKINNTVSTSPIKKITREIATSTDEINNTVSASQINKITREIATSTDKINNTVSTSLIKKVREIATNTDKINDTISNSQIKKITREIATSTDNINNTVSTSLIKKVREIATNTDEIIDPVSTSLIKKITKEIATSTDEINNTVSTSPIKKLREIATNKDEIINTVSTSPPKKKTREICTNTYNNLDEVTTSNKVHTHIAQAKECLELNNSNNLSHDNNMDYEIESILSTMKLNYKTVSPIPRTPLTRTHVVSSMLSDHNEHLRICKHCKSAQKIREQKFSELKAMVYSMEPFILNNNINSNDTAEMVYTENNVKGLQNVIPEKSTEEIYEDSNWIQIDLTQSNPPLLPDENDIPIIDTNTDNLNNRHDENSLSEISLSGLQDQNPKQLLTVEQTRDSEIHMNKDKEESPNNSIVNNQPSTKNSNIKKGRSKKTKLEKLRKSLKPKYKIRSETPPISKSRIKQTQRTVPENKVTESINTSTSLNDKNAYARAVKVMAEINAQKLSLGLSQKPDQSVKHSSPKRNAQMNDHIDSGDNNNVTSPKSLISTRSKRRYVELDCSVILEKNPLVTAAVETKNFETKKVQNTKPSNENTPRKRRQRSFDSEIQTKRVLRSATINQRLSTENKQDMGNAVGGQHRKSIEAPNANGNEISDTPLHVVPDIPKKDQAPQCQQVDRQNSNVITSYDGLDIFSVDTQPENETCPVKQPNTYFLSGHPRESILCTMLLRYGSESGRTYVKTVPEATLRVVCEKFEQEIPKIITLPNDERKNAMIRFAADLQKLNCKHLVTGLIMFLSKPERKMELFGKIKSSYCPAMTEYEQILLFLIRHLKTHWTSVDLVDAVLSSIEYSIFKLNRTPDFNVIESISHFYALLCRYHGAMSRLRIFMLDALYCIQFKAIPLIKQCLDVWMQIIPLAHMRNAKTPLVMCLVYLLHFYKCVDKYNRVQEMRNILSRKYFYQITDWNERQILEVFKQAIMDVNENPIERKMLRMALIILAKRQGPQWCQNQIIKNLLLPLIEKKNVSNTVKEFCVCMIGPLMKPYPADMKVYCEIAFNQLTNILDNEPSRSMEEAAIRSMMLINRHNQNSINKMLLKRKMMNPMSLDLEETLRDYVKTKPLKIWLKMLPKMSLN